MVMIDDIIVVLLWVCVIVSRYLWGYRRRLGVVGVAVVVLVAALVI